jgi:hypothetical protein
MNSHKVFHYFETQSICLTSRPTAELRRLRVGKTTFIIQQLCQQDMVENRGGSKSL